MGEFEVSLTFRIKGDDMRDAATAMFRMISENPPYRFWVLNEGGVAEEITLTPEDRRSALASEGVAAPDNLIELTEELMRLGITMGATGQQDDPTLTRRADDLKHRIAGACR